MKKLSFYAFSKIEMRYNKQMRFYSWQEENLFLSVVVQPKASRNEISGVQNDRLKIRTTAPPADGKANESVINLLAQCFDVPKSQVILVSGETQRHKRFCIKSPKRLLANIEKDA
jgi:uncharacterized protein (TIGR00251 family)